MLGCLAVYWVSDEQWSFLSKELVTDETILEAIDGYIEYNNQLSEIPDFFDEIYENTYESDYDFMNTSLRLSKMGCMILLSESV